MHPSLSICGIALVLEALIGYPTALFHGIGHPVTWIGAVITAVDRRFNRDDDARAVRRGRGLLTIGALIVACGLAAEAVTLILFDALPPALAILCIACLASSCLAQRSLDSHVRAVAEALRQNDLAAGRAAVARIVGRDVAMLDEAGVARAAIESLAENFADGIVAPALWLACLGLPGAVMYKAINTADSMIGHRTPRHESFGWFAAKLDDVVNWPAARGAALLIVAAAAPGGSPRDAWRIMRRDSSGHASPNAGWPEAAMAGALGITLGGPRVYAGRTVEDARIGDGSASVGATTICRALSIYRIACMIEIALIVVLATVTARF